MIRTPLVALAGLALLVLPAGAASAVPAQAPGCPVGSAQLDWGFKESFRAYIDGSIANGEWTVADGATYATPSFGFPGVDGRIDPRDPNGSVAFAGSVRFTGHGGILDTTIAQPVLVLRGDGTALLLLDVQGPTMDGDPIDVAEVLFVTVDLSQQDVTPANGIVTIDEAPTALTVEGAEAFPNYPAGEPFDPLSATIDVGGCDLTGQPIGTDTIVDEPTAGDASAGDDQDGMPWLPVAVLGVLVAAGAGVVLTASRARARRGA